MVNLGKAMIEDAVMTERFACDLGRCKGACCTLPGGRGAPLDDSEVAELESAFPIVRKYLSDRNLAVIASQGMVEGSPGNYVTSCVDDKDCVFVLYEDGIARCSLEKAYLAGEISWRKPVSCHLFPIRVSPGGSWVRYEQISECDPGVVRGRAEDVPLYDFLREPLTRKFGVAWYDEFRKECLRRDGANTGVKPRA